MRRLVRWNLSSRARQLSGGDAIVVSIPKSGRTWVRTFLCAYFCEKIGQPFTLEPEHYKGVPRIIYTHDLFEQRTKADRWDKLRGKYLDPRAGAGSPPNHSARARSARCLRLAVCSADPANERNT